MENHSKKSLIRCKMLSNGITKAENNFYKTSLLFTAEIKLR